MNIVILSRNASLYSTQSLVYAAKRRNHFVRVLDHMQCGLIIDNYKPKVFYNNIELKGVQAIIPRIGSTVTRYGATVIRQFEAMGVFSTISSDALLRSRDKVSCMQILMANNIKVPKSALCHYSDSYPTLIDQIGPSPHIVKLVEGTHGMGVVLSEKKSTTESILEAFHAGKQKVLVQEYIKEAAGADIRVFIVNDEIVGVMKRQAAPGEFRSNLHRGGKASIVSLSEEEKQTALKSVKILGLKVAGVDMLQSKHGPMVLEVNASPGLEGIETTTKNDIAGKIIRFVEMNKKW